MVFYYRTYDENRQRLCGHSTGQTTKTAAREFCNRLSREGKLIPEKQDKITIPIFAKFAKGWWDYDTCPYLKSRKGRRDISKGYTTQGQYAVKQKIIKLNPCKNVELLKTSDEKEIKILSPDEVKQLFPAQWETVWNSRLYYVLNKLAACTGMRHGELLGLRGEFVFESYIDACAQYNRYGYGDVKTHKPRNIPIPAGLHRDLETLMGDNGQGYLFSAAGGRPTRPCMRRLKTSG